MPIQAIGPDATGATYYPTVFHRSRGEPPSAELGTPIDLTTVDHTLAKACAWVHVGTAGNLNVILEGSPDAVLYENVPAGRFEARVVTFVKSGTTALKLVANN